MMGVWWRSQARSPFGGGAQPLTRSYAPGGTRVAGAREPTLPSLDSSPGILPPPPRAHAPRPLIHSHCWTLQRRCGSAYGSQARCPSPSRSGTASARPPRKACPREEPTHDARLCVGKGNSKEFPLVVGGSWTRVTWLGAAARAPAMGAEFYVMEERSARALVAAWRVTG